jgi:hypothetical protein
MPGSRGQALTPGVTPATGSYARKLHTLKESARSSFRFTAKYLTTK